MKIYIIFDYFLNLKTFKIHLKYVLNLTNCFKKLCLKFILCNPPLNKKKINVLLLDLIFVDPCHE